MSKYNNLLIITGTGRNSGKTSLACAVTSHMRELDPVAVKISPHFHEPGPGLKIYYSGENYNIYTETLTGSGKDTSRLLRAGAAVVYYIQADDEYIKEAFDNLFRNIPVSVPVICESPSLAAHISPAVLFIADNSKIANRKDISHLLARATAVFNPLEQTAGLSGLRFTGERWLFG